MRKEAGASHRWVLPIDGELAPRELMYVLVLWIAGTEDYFTSQTGTSSQTLQAYFKAFFSTHIGQRKILGKEHICHLKKSVNLSHCSKGDGEKKQYI